jgi:hypothetical protein
MWGDGFYVNGATDVWFCAVTADYNRRQGLSIIDVDGLTVANSVFSNTQGVRPSAGVDLEPNNPSQRITGVRIEHSQFIDNAGAGIQIAGKKGRVSEIEVAHNVFRGTPAVDVENAPYVRQSSVCGNHQISHRSQFFDALLQLATFREGVAIKKDCEELRLGEAKAIR